MAKSPLTTAAGGPPLSDLLFSPRAAFIWNDTRKSVAWMNPAARAAFALRLEDFSAALPPSLIRRFGQHTGRKEGGTAKVKIARAPALSCAVEILKLADGQDGLIVAELAEEDARAARLPHSKSQKRAAGPNNQKRAEGPKKKAARKGRARPARQGQKTPGGPPPLTAEEMRTFKAVGRKVLRLCEDKKPPPEAAAAVSPAAPANAGLSAGAPAQALRSILAAFDLVLYLDDGLDIMGIQGRPGRLGWRKAHLRGKSVGDLLLREDRAVLRRMLKKLRAPASESAKGALVVRGKSGNGTPCRAILGRWGEDGAPFFLALLSLELPRRLKRPKPQEGLAAARLAA